LKVAVFHDYIGSIGGGERVALVLARALKGDLITTDVSDEALRNLGYSDINLIRLGDTIKIPPLRQISASWKFATCDFADEYDLFIFPATGPTMRQESTGQIYGTVTHL